MSQQYDNNNRGALFPAREKRTPNSPDYTGEININGVDYFISGWGKTGRNGQKFVSLAVTPKQQRNDPPAAAPGWDNDPLNSGNGNLF